MRCEMFLGSIGQVEPQHLADILIGEQAIGYGYSAIFAYTDQLPRCDFNAIMVQVTKQNIS